MLTLYDFGNSVCCQKVRITLRAKALDWESVKVDLFKAEQYKALGVLAAATIRK
jgi:glutathione S-transferase